MAGTERLDFFSNSAAGTSAQKFWKGGKLFFYAEATWGGGNVKLQFISPHGTAIDVASSTISANGGLVFELPPGLYQAVGATASAIYCSAITIPTITTR